MSKLLVSILFVFSTAAHADAIRAEKPIVCFDTKTFLKQIKEKYGEEPMIIGKTSGVAGVVTSVYINKETGSFTIAEIDHEAACVISVGTEVRYRYPKPNLSL